MKPLNKFSKEFFNKYKDTPVKLKPFSFRMRKLADKYIEILSDLFKGDEVEIDIIGSVAYKIPTNDVEIAVYTKEGNWQNVLNILKAKFGDSLNEEKEFARFEVKGEEYDFDIRVYKGHEGLVSKKLTKFMLSRPEIIVEYNRLKEKYSFSRKEYQFRKNEFLNHVTEIIPDNY